MRALIVEDDETMRSLVSLTLQLAGIEVAGEAADAAIGVRAWRDHQPDVIVFDQHLPGLTGLEAAAHILGEDPTVRIVLISAHLDDVDFGRARSLGVTTITKDRVCELPGLVAA